MKLMFVDTAAWVAAADSADAACPFVQESRDQWLSAGGLFDDNRLCDRRNSDYPPPPPRS